MCTRKLFSPFFGGLECVGTSFAYEAQFVFLRDVWIRSQRAAVASRRATNLATHLSINSCYRISDDTVPVLRIHDILGWIRIRGSMPVTNGSGFGSGSWIRISSLNFKMPVKNKFFNTILPAYYFLKLHLHHFSKIKVKKSHKIAGIKVFFTIFA